MSKNIFNRKISRLSVSSPKGSAHDIFNIVNTNKIINQKKNLDLKNKNSLENSNQFLINSEDLDRNNEQNDSIETSFVQNNDTPNEFIINNSRKIDRKTSLLYLENRKKFSFPKNNKDFPSLLINNSSLDSNKFKSPQLKSSKFIGISKNKKPNLTFLEKTNTVNFDINEKTNKTINEIPRVIKEDIEAEKNKETDREKKNSKHLQNKLKKKIKFLSSVVRGVSPKYFHEFSQKKIDENIRSTQRSIENHHFRSKTKIDFIKINKDNTKKKKNCVSLSKINILPSKINKNEIFDYYIDLLKKVELIRFTCNMNSATNRSHKIDNIRITDSNDAQCFSMLSGKIGKEYFFVLKKIFNTYSLEKNGNKILTIRQIFKIKEIFFPELDSQKLELLCIKKITNKKCDFRSFIELLFSVNRELEGKNKKNINKEQEFRNFLNKNIVPAFSKIEQKNNEFDAERIQIFYHKYDEYENPVVGIFVESDKFLKHLFALYERKDIKKSANCFMDLKSFLQLCNKFQIIPLFINLNQAIKLFRTFQQNSEEIISFSSFIMILCCISHIGLNSSNKLDEFKGFYQKILKLIQNLMKINNEISETLILSKLFN